MIIYHTAEANIRSYKHSTCSSKFINSKYDCRSKIDKITYLINNSFRNQLRCCNVPPNHRPVCSLISQQRCHPRAGHDSPRNKGTSRITHSQGYTKHSQANSVGFIRPSTRQPSQHGQDYQAIQELGKAKSKLVRSL